MLSDLSEVNDVLNSLLLSSELDLYRLHGGEPPACSITLCFGEELNAADDPTNKLIIVQVNVRVLHTEY